MYLNLRPMRKENKKEVRKGQTLEYKEPQPKTIQAI